MYKRSLLAPVLLAGLLVAGRLEAADSPFTVVRTPDLIGKQVKNPSGVVLGKVEDYVINIKEGTVVYGVLLYGDTLGFGGKLFAIPPTAMTLDADGRSLTLNVDRDALEGAAGFDANKWPSEPDPRWGGKGEPKKDDPRKDDPKKDEDRALHLRRVTSLVGMTVRNTKGEDLGSVQGLALDLKNAKVVYAAMAYGGVAGVGSKMFAVPWEALSIQSPTLKAGDRVFVLDAAKAELDKLPGFDPNRWPVEADKQAFKAAKEPARP